MPVLNPNALIDERVAALREAHTKAGIPRAELDLSGGIDSAVMAGLLVLALGPDNITLVHSNINSNGSQTRRAQDLAAALGCPMININLSGIYRELIALSMSRIVDAYGSARVSLVEARIAHDSTILGSVRSTLRAPVGRMFNRLMGGGLRHGTGNEDEDRFLRFYQKGGDGEVDSNPLAFLSKGETYQLAWGLGERMGPKVKAAFRPIIAALPSPDLWGVGDAHSDEAELQKWLSAPFTYSRIDPATGNYCHVGTIERVSRFLDTIVTFPDTSQATAEKVLFSDVSPNRDDMYLLVQTALTSPMFLGSGITQDDLICLLYGARKAEASTRHKLNPNIPTYGNRANLVEDGILTDELPVM